MACPSLRPRPIQAKGTSTDLKHGWNEWLRTGTARPLSRPANLLLQVLGLLFLVDSDASRLDRRFGQETGGGIRRFVSLVPFGTA